MRKPPNVVQYNRRSGDLVWNEDKFNSFPSNGERDFKELRQYPEFCFFDKTAFIKDLESFRERAVVFLRPRRSGKSLALSTLAHFHGREHLPDYKPLFEVSDICLFNEYFYLLRMSSHMHFELLSFYLQGLAIDEHVTNNRVSPGQFFVLQLDFSAVDRSQDREVARHSLNLLLNRSIKQFYKTYEPYLRMSADHLIQDLIKDDATASLGECVNLVHNILSSIANPEDPLSKIKGVCTIGYPAFCPLDNAMVAANTFSTTD